MSELHVHSITLYNPPQVLHLAPYKRIESEFHSQSPKSRIFGKLYGKTLKDFESEPFLKRLANSLVEECDKIYSTIRYFINTRISIALARATNRCIIGSKNPPNHIIPNNFH